MQGLEGHLRPLLPFGLHQAAPLLPRSSPHITGWQVVHVLSCPDLCLCTLPLARHVGADLAVQYHNHLIHHEG